MFNKLTKFLTVACLFSAVLSAPMPQNTGSGNAVAGSNENLQPFAGALGGAVAPSVSCGDNKFTVEGDESFDDLASALARSCDILETECINFAKSAAGMASGLTVAECEHQDEGCRASIASVSNTATCPIVARAVETQGTPQGMNPGNVQTFTGALGGQPAPAITRGDNGFQVKGGAMFKDLPTAVRSSCDMQKQRALKAGVSVAECNQQEDQCLAAMTSALPASGAKPPSMGKSQDKPTMNNAPSTTNAHMPMTPGNIQTFGGALGGQNAPAVSRGNDGFQVEGGNVFADLPSALRSSCDVQKKKAINDGLPVAECDEQHNECIAAITSNPPASGAKSPALGKRQNSPLVNAPLDTTLGNAQTFGGAVGGQRAPADTPVDGGSPVKGGAMLPDVADRLPVNNRPLPANGPLPSPKRKTPPPPTPARIGSNRDDRNTPTFPGGRQPVN